MYNAVNPISKVECVDTVQVSLVFLIVFHICELLFLCVLQKFFNVFRYFSFRG